MALFVDGEPLWFSIGLKKTMNIKFCLKQVSALAAIALSSSKLSNRVLDNVVDLDEAFRLQAKFDGVVGAKSVSFGSVSVSKTFRKFFADDEAAVLSALWSVVVSVDKSKGQVLADLRPSTPVVPSVPSIQPATRLTAAEVAASFTSASIVV